MQFSPQQDAALIAVAQWLDDPGASQVFRLFGYAGTGKTTLARHFAEGIEGDVLFGAFTGKAAYVLRQKGCPSASTIHSMIYRTQEKGTSNLRMMEAELAKLVVELTSLGKDPSSSAKVRDMEAKLKIERDNVKRPFFKLNVDSPVKNAKLVVIDECSMVDADMGVDLLSFGTKVLVLGDPAQLPPVGGAGYFTEGVKPDVMLTEIHRQAEDDPIIHMATRIRSGQRLNLGTYGESRVILQSELKAEDALGADQLLVGRNKTRFSYNRRLRQLLGRGGSLPEQGDKLVCLRNNHDLGLLNGAIWHTLKSSCLGGERVLLDLRPEMDGLDVQVEAHTHYFEGVGDTLPWFERKLAEEFDFGYALTCHKSQGSQWDNVLVLDESSCFRADKDRWLYTAVTRAAKKVTVAV